MNQQQRSPDIQRQGLLLCPVAAAPQLGVAHTCLAPAPHPPQDLILPPMMSPHKLQESPLMGAPTRERSILGFFKGGWVEMEGRSKREGGREEGRLRRRRRRRRRWCTGPDCSGPTPPCAPRPRLCCCQAVRSRRTRPTREARASSSRTSHVRGGCLVAAFRAVVAAPHMRG